MNEESMRKLPYKQVSMTIDEMIRELRDATDAANVAHQVYRDKPSPERRQNLVHFVAKVRTLAEEILRWELL